MRNFFLIKHHPRGLTEAYQERASVLGGTPCSLNALPRVPETLPGQR
jgi:hypothetical protein